MMKRYLFSIGLAVVMLLILASSAYCRMEKIISSVEVRGNKTVSSATILSKIETRIGSYYSESIVGKDLKRLYALGFFTDIKVELVDYAEEVKVIFMVTEKPTIKEIAFEGNRRLRSKMLREVFESKEGEFLNRKQLKDDVDEIKKLYEKKGFPEASVEHSVEMDEENNRAKILVSVDEAARLRIKRIEVNGNKVFPDKRILKLISTRRDTLFTSGVLKKKVLDEDMEKLKVFYQRAGYMDVKASYETSYDYKRRGIFISINIEEGKKYLVGKVDLRGHQKFAGEEIRKGLKMTSGKIFTQSGLREDIASIQGYYFEKGYISAEVASRTLIDEETGKVDITYEIVENEQAFVEKIRIIGNSKTKDVVIRRELRILPGERFDGYKLRRSKERLYNLGFFEETSYDTRPGTAPDKRDLVVEVKEAKTGEFSFGAGYSSVEQFVGFIEVAQKNFDIANFPNFTGDGQDLRMRAEFGTVRRDYELSFTEPWIFDYPLLFGFDLYQRTRERGLGYSYNERRRGGDLRLGKEFTEFVRGDLAYRLENIKISDLPSDASPDLITELGENTVSSLLIKATRDTRDSILSPTRGIIASSSVEYAGGVLGGDKDFTKYIGGLTGYHTQFDKLLLELRLRAGIVDAFGNSDDVSIYERFYAGGTYTIRGYDERKVGPRDEDYSNLPIGGKSMLIFNAEYTYPIFKNFKGAAFYDVGNVWSKVSDFGSGNFQSGVGVGVRIKTPIGPMKLDYGIPLDSYPGEAKEGRFHFSMSRAF